VTLLDIALIMILVIFFSMGARAGSVWVAGCLAAGLIGACLVDYYALSFGTHLGGFPGATFIAGFLIYGITLLIVLLPSLFLSNLSSGFILGLIDGAFGLLAGGLSGLCAVTLFFLIFVPRLHSLEASQSWNKSLLVKPIYRYVEKTFNGPHFGPISGGDVAREELVGALAPAANFAEERVKTAASKIVHKIKE
jgi:uncharacterized membrane protein required for colicin V production